MPNTHVRAAAEGMPAINRRRLLLGLVVTSTAAAAAAALAAASTLIDATAAPSVAGPIPSTGRASLDAKLLLLPPEEANQLEDRIHSDHFRCQRDVRPRRRSPIDQGFCQNGVAAK
ncbi:hypothetical protein [Mesorhizobium muleiense]|uniref:Uncharacterized protein n=1 Tax=Mesorhizobium muleiense TaxID=1004279 RepID=A0A1G9BX54_9HYPH|nr:hypothetical protein [Mesorhizobium muleiense]MCF6103850.1 hypothetical protein [Mesorhizobium muleiense]SDK43535.1 hypothetical protein SAMN05428953_11583 [Mesorhizobium muleiense]